MCQAKAPGTGSLGQEEELNEAQRAQSAQWEGGSGRVGGWRGSSPLLPKVQHIGRNCAAVVAPQAGAALSPASSSHDLHELALEKGWAHPSALAFIQHVAPYEGPTSTF